MIVTERIREIRLKNGLTQEQFGERIGVSKVTICNYENGTKQPKMLHLDKIITEFEVTPNYLLGYDHLGVSEDETDYKVVLSKEDLRLLSCLKQNKNLYDMFIRDPARTIKLINLKLKK